MKSKNRNPRNRQLGIVLVMLILLISGMLVYGLTLSNRSIVPTSTSESMWYTNWDESTVSFMNTAIAEFTKDPTLALSSTPFYAEMVNYRVLWEHTTTPDSYRNRCPQEGCPTYVFVDPMIRTFEPVTSATWDYVATEWMKWQTMSPTPLPPPAYTLTSTPPRYTATPSATWVCSPAIANWELVEDSISFENLLKEKGIEASASLFSSGVEGIDTACHLPFQPTFSRVNLWVEVDTLDDVTVLPLTMTICRQLKTTFSNLRTFPQDTFILKSPLTLAPEQNGYERILIF